MNTLLFHTRWNGYRKQLHAGEQRNDSFCGVDGTMQHTARTCGTTSTVHFTTLQAVVQVVRRANDVFTLQARACDATNVEVLVVQPLFKTIRLPAWSSSASRLARHWTVPETIQSIPENNTNIAPFTKHASMEPTYRQIDDVRITATNLYIIKTATSIILRAMFNERSSSSRKTRETRWAVWKEWGLKMIMKFKVACLR